MRLINNTKELQDWLLSLYKLPLHIAKRYNSAGIIVSNEIVKEFLCSESQGKILHGGKTISIRCIDIGYACTSVSVIDPSLADSSGYINRDSEVARKAYIQCAKDFGIENTYHNGWSPYQMADFYANKIEFESLKNQTED